MATIRKKTTKDGRTYYEILYRISRNDPQLSTRWYVPEGWSQTAIDRTLPKVSAEFERKCKAGEIISRAEQKRREAEAKAAEDAILTLKSYCEKVYLPAVKLSCSESTRDGYTRLLKGHIYPVLGDLRMCDITSAQISSLLMTLQGKLSHGSVIKVFAVISRVFKSAFLDDTISTNPMMKVQRPKPRKDEKGKDGVASLSADELKRVLDCLGNEPLKWQVYIRLLAETGIRRGEGCGLQWANIDFDNLTITIDKAIYYTPEAGVYESTTKNGRSRQVAISKTLSDLLTIYRADQASKHLSKWVFVQDPVENLTKGKKKDEEKQGPQPMFPDSATRYFKYFRDRYNIPDFHPHMLRHTFASLAITNGADIASVSEILGHADKAITLRVYSHADEESKRRASQIFLNAITGAEVKEA